MSQRTEQHASTECLACVRSLRPALVFVWVALGLVACTPHRMYRPQNVVRTADFIQAFVEIDDHGELWSPHQVERALAALEAAQDHPHGAVVNIFVHGWNHDASPADEVRAGSNVAGHKRLLGMIAAGERANRPDNPRSVVGIYIAWRGKLLKGGLNALTFFNRRLTADRVAGITATSTVYRLLTAAKTNPRSRVVLLGHSFGGLVVERALSQALIGALFSRGAAERQAFEFPADLVLLVNPASPALHAKQFVEALGSNRLKLYREDSRGVVQEMPLVVSLTSEGDWATGIFYPLGLRLLAARKRYRAYGDDYCGANASQRSFTIRTAGHHEILHSHQVTAETLAPGTSTADDPAALAPERLWHYDPLTQQPVITFDGDAHRFQIKRRRRAFNDTPYWIMRVPKSLIPDHSQVFGDNTFRMVRALLTATGALDPGSHTRLMREDGIRPIGLAPAPGGGVLFLDRSRRIFHIADDDRGPPTFFACLPAALDPRGGLGFAYEDGAYISAQVLRHGRSDRFETSFRLARIEPTGVAFLGTVEVKSNARYVAMAADVPGRRGFLVPADAPEIWQVDLTAKRPQPRRMVRFEQAERRSLILYRPGANSLFAVDDRGTIRELDLATSNIRTVADTLGQPTALAYDTETGRLLVADSLNRRVWRLDCGASCAPPAPYFVCDHLEQPTTLRVMAGGDAWIGDIRSQVLARVSRDGEVMQAYTSLRRGAVSAAVVQSAASPMSTNRDKTDSPIDQRRR